MYSACSGESTSITISGNNGATVNWSSDLFNLSGTGTTINTNTLTNKGTAPYTITYTIEATLGACTDITTATVTVLPEPRVIATPHSAIICDFEMLSIQLDEVVTGTNVSWVITNDANATAVASGTGTNISTPLPSGNYTLTVTGTKDGCTYTNSIPVTVN